MTMARTVFELIQAMSPGEGMTLKDFVEVEGTEDVFRQIDTHADDGRVHLMDWVVFIEKVHGEKRAEGKGLGDQW